MLSNSGRWRLRMPLANAIAIDKGQAADSLSHLSPLWSGLQYAPQREWTVVRPSATEGCTTWTIICGSHLSGLEVWISKKHVTNYHTDTQITWYINLLDIPFKEMSEYHCWQWIIYSTLNHLQINWSLFKLSRPFTNWCKVAAIHIWQTTWMMAHVTRPWSRGKICRASSRSGWWGRRRQPELR